LTWRRYIIDHFERLRNVTIFVHAERYQWHNDDPDYDGMRNLARLNITYVQSQGYVNLRCAWLLGCPAEIHPLVDASHTGTPIKTKEVYKKSFEELFPGIEVPATIGTSCCAQFAVAKEAIQSRPKQDYEKYRQWIIETDLADDLSGRVLEYSWHSKSPTVMNR